MNDQELTDLTRAAGVPDEASACHTAQVGGYVIEGHVPAATIRRLLREKPAIVGLSIPGMIQGTPGMGDPGPGTHYDVVAINRDGSTNIYERH